MVSFYHCMVEYPTVSVCEERRKKELHGVIKVTHDNKDSDSDNENYKLLRKIPWVTLCQDFKKYDL